MKYRIDFPITKECDLHCYYCFHSDYHKKIGPYQNKSYDLGFTLEEWERWRNKFLFKAEEILLNLHGGETFHSKNILLVFNLINHCKNSIQTYEFLSNGLSPLENYQQICIPFKDKIKRIGFTYHREMIDHNEHLKKLFENTVLDVKQMGINVYVKELLMVKHRDEIIKNKNHWNGLGIDFKVQDFKGVDKGFSFEEYSKYTLLDYILIDDEYKHPKNQYCTCLSGYKSFGIRGFDEFSGDVIACWQNPVVVGNIKEMWFNPNFRVDREENSSKRKIIGVPLKYRGTNDKDLPLPCNT